MKILYLLRHAYSHVRDRGLADYDRPLVEEGRQQAQAVSQYLHKNKRTFDFVMCSGALRTRETLEFLRPDVGTKDIELAESFYNCTEDQILNHLHHIANKWKHVLYIGHNPGIAFAAYKFAKEFPQDIAQNFAPATLVGFEFPIDDWTELDWWQGKIIDRFQPPVPSGDTPAPEES